VWVSGGHKRIRAKLVIFVPLLTSVRKYWVGSRVHFLLLGWCSNFKVKLVLVKICSVFLSCIIIFHPNSGGGVKNSEEWSFQGISATKEVLSPHFSTPFNVLSTAEIFRTSY